MLHHMTAVSHNLCFPFVVFVHQCAEYQNRRGTEKIREAERRQALMAQEPTDITPANKSQHVWSSAATVDKFENDWSMKPVQIKGIFDHEREIQVKKERNGEKGVDIITPFYTHVDAQGIEQGIIVNRGWVPQDLKDQRMHYGSNTMGTIKGVLYRGDVETKYSTKNSPMGGLYNAVRPYDCSLIMQLPNQEEASQVMLHMIDFDPERRQVLPTVPTVGELSNFVISPQRHAAYEMMWRMMAFGGVLANTALWLYF